MRAKTAKAASDILTELRALSHAGALVEPSDSPWKTSRQWAAEWGVSHGQAGKLLTVAVAGGKMTIEQRPSRTVMGYARKQPHYKYVG